MTRLLLTLSMLAVTSCTSSKVNSNRIEPAAFPDAFKCNDCVLLVIKRVGGVNPGGMNRYLEKSFTKNYTGKFEMVTPEQVDKDKKYQDKKVYRFLVSDGVSTGGQKVETSHISNGMKTSTTVDYNYTYTLDYRLYDRLLEKGYPSMGVASNVPAKAMNRASVLLNKKLTE